MCLSQTACTSVRLPGRVLCFMNSAVVMQCFLYELRVEQARSRRSLSTAGTLQSRRTESPLVAGTASSRPRETADLEGVAEPSKVRLPADRRTHVAGQLLSLATGGFLAPERIVHRPRSMPK